MNSLIPIHPNIELNEFQFYECRRREGAPVYIALIHSSQIAELPRLRTLVERIPFAMPPEWAKAVMKKLDGIFASTQMRGNKKNKSLVFNAKMRYYVQHKVKVKIEQINHDFIQING